MKRKNGGISVVVLCALCCVATICLCFLFVLIFCGGPAAFADMMKYMAVRSIISSEYIGEVDYSELEDKTFRAMVEATQDHWSYYMNQDEYESYNMFSENKYMGIGVTIEEGYEADGLRIISVSDDSPAARAGILPGMIISSINEVEMYGKTVSEARALIVENQNNSLELLLIKEDGSPLELLISAETIFSDPVSWEMLSGNIGYIKLSNFEDGSADGVSAAIEGLLTGGAAAIVFDVRNNPGGKVSQLIRILDMLLPEGDIFVSVNKRGEEKTEESDSECIEMPMSVLVNRDSYSAAEFFAAALSEYGWAAVVGEPTTGKSRSQTTFELNDGSAVHISSGAYLTPNRVDLSETGGLIPDTVIELGDEDRKRLSAEKLDKYEDTQLTAAIEILLDLVIANKLDTTE